jgi:hypothetical protein
MKAIHYQTGHIRNAFLQVAEKLIQLKRGK